MASSAADTTEEPDRTNASSVELQIIRAGIERGQRSRGMEAKVMEKVRARRKEKARAKPEEKENGEIGEKTGEEKGLRRKRLERERSQQREVLKTKR